MPANGEQADRTEENEAKHALASSWSLGPRVEALEVLQSLFEQALKRHKQTRDELANEDRYFFITEDMKKLDIYQESIAPRETNSESLSEIPAKHSVPFWSPRYNAHMNMDTTLASIIRSPSSRPSSSKTCNAGPKEFLKLTKKELLNLTTSTVLSIPTLLGKDELKREFDIKHGNT
ncbi:hypothetical protein AAL_07332 [Moelleriella libera RCEF 2490]|uniref:Uncharacterized protein n=1 Tax=Moelleriella libera RCEF 2490 TaxID=1081109 RepID=A0A167XLF1_9HYPO|nr:hypothetical protein AAL_07332 [Moelleriella libera RCEF 2490]